jgi:hypothetical protein
MTTDTITVEGTLQADGVTLRLEKKVALPPGRVTVTVQPAAAKAGPARRWWRCSIAFTATNRRAGASP